MADYELSMADGIAHLRLTRIKAGNALGAALWNTLPGLVSELDRSGTARAMVLSADGPIFCAGMDLSEFSNGIPHPVTPAGRESFYHLALSLQETFTAFERARFPVIAAVHGPCLGAGLELVAACDLRFAASDAEFRIEEINMGIMADVGALQRLPKLLPDPVVRRMALLGYTLSAQEAARFGFVCDVLPTSSAALNSAFTAAQTICEKAPVAIAGSKAALRWARDHSVPDALEWSARTQSALWSSHDILSAYNARKSIAAPDFEPLQPKRPLGDGGR
jgi:enoyl-CoA hydratase